MTEVANLTIKADATSVDASKNSLRGLSAEAKNTGSAIRDMAEKIQIAEAAHKAEYLATRQSATAHLEAAKASHQATTATQANAQAVRMSADEFRKLTSATKDQTAATQSATKAHQDIVNAIRSGQPVTHEAIKAAGGLAAAMKIMEGAHNKAGPAVENMAKTAHKTRMEIGGLTIQTSTFVRELLVLGREAGRGDWTRFAGSMTILGQAMGLTPLLMTAADAAIAGFGVAVVGVLGILHAGEKEFNSFNNSLTATGNYAGFTADSMEHMAHRIAESQKVGIRATKEGIASLTASGKYQADVIDLMMQSASKYAKLTGQSVTEIVKGYETMKGGIVRWAVKHTEVYHDLTFAQIEYIDKLEKLGKHHEAELFMMSAINKEVSERTIPQFGYLQTMLRSVSRTASDMWDKILGWGRPKTLGQQLEKAEEELNSAIGSQGPIRAPKGSAYEAALIRQREHQLGTLRAKVTGLRAEMAAEEKKAAADAKAAEIEDDKIRRRFDNGGFRPSRRTQFGDGDKVDQVKERQEALQAEIDGNRGLVEAYDMSSAAGFRAAAVKKALADAAKTNGEASQFEALEITAAVTKATAEGAKQVQALEEKTKAQKEANAIVALTGASQQVANQMVQNATVISLLQAAADNAATGDKARLLDLIIRTKEAQEDANRVSRDTLMAQRDTALKERNAELEIELRMINATNRERAVALVQLRTEQQLRKDDVDPKSSQGRSAVKAAIAVVNKEQDLAGGVGDLIQQGKFYLDLQDEMIARTKDAASAMSGSFGEIGDAISNLTTVFTDHYTAVDRMELDYAQRRKDANGDDEKLAALEKARLAEKKDKDLQYYGDVAGAAASFFNKQSGMYKTLHAVEMGFRAFELAMSVQSMVQKTLEAGHTIATNAVIQTSNTATGATSMFAWLGPFAFPAIAAMLAVLASFGASSSGSSGGSSAVARSGGRQTAQGSGTVLGDTTSKSASLENSLKTAASNSVKYLETSNQMLDALRSIDDKIGVLASAIARTMQLSGSMFDTKGLGLGTTGNKGFLGIGGKTTTKELSDLGVEFASQTIADILSNGVKGRTYQETMSTTTKTGFWGLGGGTKTGYATSYGSIDSEVQTAIQDTIKALKGGISEAAKVLGITGAEEALNSFTLALGTVSFADMTGQEIEDTLNAVFSKAGDQMAEAVMPGFKTLQKTGEGMMETLVRVARDYQVVDMALQSIGKTFGAVGLASVAARENLVDLAGGADKFADQANFFAENFLTQAEQMAPVQATVVKQMADINLAWVDTRDEFKNVVLGLDLTTEAGRATYSALMTTAPAFAKVQEYLEELAANGGKVGDNLEVIKRRKEIQDKIDELTLSSSELTQKQRSLEMEAALKLDASLGVTLQTFYDLSDAADAYNKRQEEQKTEIGLMRQLQAMDDAVLGTNVALVNNRQDELDKLSPLGKYLQDLIWKRQDEADLIAKNAQILNQHLDLEARLASVRGDDSLRVRLDRERELKEALDDTSRATLREIYLVEDRQKALDKAQTDYDTATSALEEGRSALLTAYTAEADGLQSVIDKFGAFGKSLRDFIKSLDMGELAQLTRQQKLDATQNEFRSVFDKLQNGTAEERDAAFEKLQNVGEEYLRASLDAQSTNVGYFRTLAEVKRATQTAVTIADKEVDTSKAQLQALKDLVSPLVDINQSVNTVAEEIIKVQALLAAQTQALAVLNASKTAVTGGTTPPVTPPVVATSPPAFNPNGWPVVNGIAIDPSNPNNGQRWEQRNTALPDFLAFNPDGKRVNLGIGANGLPINLYNGWEQDGAPTSMTPDAWQSANSAWQNTLAQRNSDMDMQVRKALAAQGRTDYPGYDPALGFRTGGEFVVGGVGGPDSKRVQMNLTPTEVVNVQRGDQIRRGENNYDAMVKELQAMRKHLETTSTLNTVSLNKVARFVEQVKERGVGVRAVDPAKPIEVTVV